MTLAKMAGGTDGNIISFDASGNPVAISTGNDGQVLTSAGAGAQPAFEDAAGGGAWTLINSTVASSSADVTITGLSSTYGTYALAITDLVPSSGGENLYARFGTSSGIDTASSVYGTTGRRVEYTTAWGGGYSYTSSLQDQMQVSQTSLSDSGTAHALWYLSGIGIADNPPGIRGWTRIFIPSSDHYLFTFFASRTTAITADRIKIYMSSGNIASGRITVWGIKHT